MAWTRGISKTRLLACRASVLPLNYVSINAGPATTGVQSRHLTFFAKRTLNQDFLCTAPVRFRGIPAVLTVGFEPTA